MRIRKRTEQQVAVHKTVFRKGWLGKTGISSFWAKQGKRETGICGEWSNLECIIGDEQPRTPPPCCGEKQHMHTQHGDRYESVKRKKKRSQIQHNYHDADDSTSERSSHENCGPQRFMEDDGDSLAQLVEISNMDPLLRAVLTVVSEAGSEGLTAREAAQRILSRGLLGEADIPRTVKMAKAMRECPYLVEMSKSSKFFLWSTFLRNEKKDEVPRKKRKKRVSNGKMEEEEQEEGQQEEKKGKCEQVPQRRFMFDLNLPPDECCNSFL